MQISVNKISNGYMVAAQIEISISEAGIGFMLGGNPSKVDQYYAKTPDEVAARVRSLLLKESERGVEL